MGGALVPTEPCSLLLRHDDAGLVGGVHVILALWRFTEVDDKPDAFPESTSIENNKKVPSLLLRFVYLSIYVTSELN